MPGSFAGRLLGVFCAVLLVAACQKTGDPPPTLVRSADGIASVAMVEPAIEAGVLTVGGVFEPRADWTDKVYKNVLAAFAEEGERRGLNLTPVEIDGLPLEDQQAFERVRKIHRRVALAKALHSSHPNFALPTKGKRYHASLGRDAAAPLGKLTDRRYAAMLSIRDSYTSGGRAAAIFLAAAIFGAAVEGGTTAGYFSLVDVKTGEIVWQSVLPRHSELRTPEGALVMAKAVLDDMQGKSGS